MALELLDEIDHLCDRPPSHSHLYDSRGSCKMRRQIAPKPHRTDRHTSDHGLFRPKALVQSTLTLSFGPPGAICTIARERTDETGDRAPLVELRHIDEHHRLFRVAQKPSLPQISSTGYPVAMAPQANPGAQGAACVSGSKNRVSSLNMVTNGHSYKAAEATHRPPLEGEGLSGLAQALEVCVRRRHEGSASR